MKKIDKFSLNYHRHMVQPLVLCILHCILLKITMVKKFSPGKKFYGGSIVPIYVQKLRIILLMLL